MKFDHSTTGFPLTGQHMHALVRLLPQQHGAAQARLRELPRRLPPRTPLAVVRQLPHARGLEGDAPARDPPHDALPADRDARARRLHAVPRARERADDSPTRPSSATRATSRTTSGPGIFPHTGTRDDARRCRATAASVTARSPGCPRTCPRRWRHDRRARSRRRQRRRRATTCASRSASARTARAACSDCHTSLSAPRAVRCVGCHAHDPVLLTQQHKQPMATRRRVVPHLPPRGGAPMRRALRAWRALARALVARGEPAHAAGRAAAAAADADSRSRRRRAEPRSRRASR